MKVYIDKNDQYPFFVMRRRRLPFRLWERPHDTNFTAEDIRDYEETMRRFWLWQGRLWLMDDANEKSGSASRTEPPP